MTRFVDSYVSREHLYSLGHDSVGGDAYLSIPVSNQMVDYEEYYSLSPAEYDASQADAAAAQAFADRCRARHEDARLILKPGSDRGSPR